VTLVRVNETDSGSDFLILNLQMVTRVEGRNFKDEQDKHQGRVFFSDGGSVNLVGADTDRVIAALEDFAGYPRL
jgi:hypothetical protein